MSTHSSPGIRVFVLLSALLGCTAPETKWERDIRAFEESARRSPPPEDAVLFVGSSSIRLWRLDESFPDLATINRGFGGSQIADSVRFAPRIVLPHKPRVVVMYAGDNDIAAAKSPERVARDFEEFVDLVGSALPETRIVFISIKPSRQRWHLAGPMCRANRLIEEITRRDGRLAYVDVWGPMLGADGEPRRELFVGDGLHLNDKGYRLWASLVRPFVDR